MSFRLGEVVLYILCRQACVEYQFTLGCQIDGKQFEPVETNVILLSLSFQLTHILVEIPRRVRMHEGPCR